MIPGMAIAMRLFACLWFALALVWSNDDALAHAAVTCAIGIGCFAYGEWLDRLPPATKP